MITKPYHPNDRGEVITTLRNAEAGWNAKAYRERVR